jgi:hypothetical protein
MDFPRLNLKALALIGAAMVLAAVVTVLARPTPIESAVLGPGWQCSRSAVVLTTCAPQVSPAMQNSAKVAMRAPRV